MKIMPNVCYTPRINSYTPSFKTNTGYYLDKDNVKQSKICTNTSAFRPDLEWDGLARQMNITFKHKNKVNVFSLACSDGSEPYSLAIALTEELKRLKTDSSKFFPIYASDKSQKMAEKNLRGLWNLHNEDLNRFDSYGYDYNKYLLPTDKKLEFNDTDRERKTQTYAVNPELRNKVKFSCADLTEQLKNIKDDSNTVILCRNVLPYLKDGSKVMEVARLAGEKLKENSLFVIGEYDYKTGITDYLKYAGFVDISENGTVFQKKKSNINQLHRISFGTTARQYVSKQGHTFGTNSWMFRDDLDWKREAKFEKTHFKNKKKVNIIQVACSDGSESCTKVISILENKPSADDEKFFPIMAYDIDAETLKGPQNGLINTTPRDRMMMQINADNMENYFEETTEKLEFEDDVSFERKKTLKMTDELRERIIFKKADMYDILNNLNDDSDTVFVCRNVLGYFDEDKIEKFVQLASKKLKKDSLFLIGEHDSKNSFIVRYLKENGFSQVMEHVYKKNN